ncbi:MAG: cobalamin biosynthesis protein [Candidatus Calescibacterium sp.]|nr:cobalamin biosynthesis protein [Candidatus Calescibacterium sp.]
MEDQARFRENKMRDEFKNYYVDREKYFGELFKKGIGLVAITLHGVKIVLKISDAIKFTKVNVFISEKLKEDLRQKGELEKLNYENIFCFKNLKELVSEIFKSYDALIFVVSLGALIRIISPYLKSKEEDPAILCIDDAGRFVISVLSGHQGGANELTQEVAKIINAIPVITTASDSIGTIPVDIFGREYGWKVEADHDTLVEVSAHMVNGRKIALVQESGERFFSLPQNVSLISTSEFFERQNEFQACLFITHILHEKSKIKIPCVFYRPRVLYCGVGFDKGIRADEIYEFFLRLFEENKLSYFSVKKIATIETKKEDDEFRKFSEFLKENFGIETVYFTKDEISSVSHLVKNPSAYAEKYVGVPSVSEACALLLAGQKSELIVQKTKFKGKSGAGLTFAVAIDKSLLYV